MQWRRQRRVLLLAGCPGLPCFAVRRAEGCVHNPANLARALPLAALHNNTPFHHRCHTAPPLPSATHTHTLHTCYCCAAPPFRSRRSSSHSVHHCHYHRCHYTSQPIFVSLWELPVSAHRKMVARIRCTGPSSVVQVFHLLEFCSIEVNLRCNLVLATGQCSHCWPLGCGCCWVTGASAKPNRHLATPNPQSTQSQHNPLA